jgi:hypothetical protein
MKQWEIWEFPIPSRQQPHCFVILSPNRVAANDHLKAVNALMCTSIRNGRALRSHETMIDQADGMDYETAVNCIAIYQLNREQRLSGVARGVVTPDRRRQIAKRVRDCFELML